MEYGCSIIMAVFVCVLLLYTGIAAISMDYIIFPLRVRVSFKPANEKKYMTRFAKVIALAALSPALSALAGLWSLIAAIIVLIGSAVLLIWIGTLFVKNVDINDMNCDKTGA